MAHEIKKIDEENYSKVTRNFHFHRLKASAMKELDDVYLNTKELNKNYPSCIRPNVISMIAKRMLQSK